MIKCSKLNHGAEVNGVLPLRTQLQIGGGEGEVVGASLGWLGSDFIVPFGGPRGGLTPSRPIAVVARPQQNLSS